VDSTSFLAQAASGTAKTHDYTKPQRIPDRHGLSANRLEPSDKGKENVALETGAQGAEAVGAEAEVGRCVGVFEKPLERQNMKYNPQYHNSVVDNIRQIAREAGLDASRVSDERLWKLHEDTYFCEDSEAALLEELPSVIADPTVE
jgi:hypothetical protein